MAFQIIHLLIRGAYEHVLLHGKREVANVFIKDLEIRSVSWIIQVGPA